MFTVTVGQVEVLFYWPEAVFRNIYWSRASGSLLASSPAKVSNFDILRYGVVESFSRK